jgi:hypothetical protein
MLCTVTTVTVNGILGKAQQPIRVPEAHGVVMRICAAAAHGNHAPDGRVRVDPLLPL